MRALSADRDTGGRFPPNAQVRMIDFAHVLPADDLDTGCAPQSFLMSGCAYAHVRLSISYIHGLRNVIEHFEQIGEIG